MYYPGHEFDNIDIHYDEYLRYRKHQELVQEVERKTRENRELEQKRTDELILEHLTRAEVERKIRLGSLVQINTQEQSRAKTEEQWVKMEADARAQNRAREREERKMYQRAKREYQMVSKLIQYDDEDTKKEKVDANLERLRNAGQILRRGAKNLIEIAENRKNVYQNSVLPQSRIEKKVVAAQLRQENRQQGIIPVRRELYDPTPNINLDDPNQVQRGKMSASYHAQLGSLSSKYSISNEHEIFQKKITKDKRINNTITGNLFEKSNVILEAEEENHNNQDDDDEGIEQQQQQNNVASRRRSMRRSASVAQYQSQNEISTFKSQATSDYKQTTSAAKKLLNRSASQANSVVKGHTFERSWTLPNLQASAPESSSSNDNKTHFPISNHDVLLADSKAQSDYSSFNSPLNAPQLRDLRLKATKKNSSLGSTSIVPTYQKKMKRSSSLKEIYSPRSQKRLLDMSPSLSTFEFDQWMQKRGKLLKRKMAPNNKVHYRLMFDLLDSNKKKKLSLDDLVKALNDIGMHFTRTEVRQMVSGLKRKDAITFDEFVNSFSTKTEWDKLFDIQKTRQKQGKEESALPFLLWVPAYHRHQTLSAIMQMKGMKKNQSTGLTGLKEKSRQAAGTTLTEQWAFIQKEVKKKNHAQEIDGDAALDALLREPVD